MLQLTVKNTLRFLLVSHNILITTLIECSILLLTNIERANASGALARTLLGSLQRYPRPPSRI